MNLSDLRPEVAAFAIKMEQQLRAHPQFTSQESDSPHELADSAALATDHLTDAVYYLMEGDPSSSKEKAISEATDAAIFCMMTIDALDGLGTLTDIGEDALEAYASTTRRESTLAAFAQEMGERLRAGPWRYEGNPRLALGDARTKLARLMVKVEDLTSQNPDGPLYSMAEAVADAAIVALLCMSAAYSSSLRAKAAEGPYYEDHLRAMDRLASLPPEERQRMALASLPEDQRPAKEVGGEATQVVEYTAATYFAAEGARVGLVTCKVCGATLLLDPRDNFSVVVHHTAWHQGGAR